MENELTQEQALEIAKKETFKEGHLYVCPVRLGVVVTGQTKEECIRNVVVELTGKPWNVVRYLCRVCDMEVSSAGFVCQAWDCSMVKVKMPDGYKPFGNIK